MRRLAKSRPPGGRPPKSRPPAHDVHDHDVDWVTYRTIQLGRNLGAAAAWQDGLAKTVEGCSVLHIVCLGVLVMALTDVAITALPALEYATPRFMKTGPRGGNPRLEKRARLQAAITQRTRAGDYRSAIELATILLEDLKSDLNDANAAGAVNVLEAGDTLASLYLLQGDPDRAESLYHQHLETIEATRKPASWAGAGVPEVLCKLGGVRASRGDDSGAESLYRRALTMCDDYSPDHPFTGEVLDALAMVCRRTDRAAEAEPLEARARSIRDERATHGPGRPRR
jgi:hypothetical protein